MSTEVKRRYGTTAQHAIFTGAAHEITIDTDKNTAVVHDGTTAGGHPLSKASELTAHEADTSTHGVTGVIIGTDGAAIHALTPDTDPLDADEFVFTDSAGTWSLLKITWANIKASIKTYYDSVTSTLTNKSISLASNTITGTKAQFNTACTDDDFVFKSEFTVLASCGVPVGPAPSGTIGNNGALTLGTALNQTYSSGVWLWFPADAIAVGIAAGFYWTVMSSTTAGTIYNNTRVSTDLPAIIASPTAFVTTGPGAYTGGAGLAELTIFEVTNTGGAMGPNGKIKTEQIANWNNSAGIKYVYSYLGASYFMQASATTTTGAALRKIVRNHGSETQQVAWSRIRSDPDSLRAELPVDLSVDTTANTQIALKIHIVAAATDYAIVDAFEITRTYGAAA